MLEPSWLSWYLKRQETLRRAGRVMSQAEIERRIKEGERACELIRLERMWKLTE